MADARRNESVKLGVDAPTTPARVEDLALGKVHGRSPKLEERENLIV